MKAAQLTALKPLLRDLGRRKGDLLGTANRLEIIRRNAMTLDALREAITILVATLRERAQMLQESIEDEIDAASTDEKASKERDAGEPNGTEVQETGHARIARIHSRGGKRLPTNR